MLLRSAGPSDLHLTVPSTHILLKSSNDTFTTPIIGALSVPVRLLSPKSPAEDCPEITVRLIRSVTPKSIRTTPKRNKKAAHLSKLYSKTRTSSRRTLPGEHGLDEPAFETVVECLLWYSPQQVKRGESETREWLQFDFSLPIPGNMPATTETVLGNVTYAIEAALITSAGDMGTRWVKASQNIKILRQVIGESVTYNRRHTGDNMETELRLIPEARHLASAKGNKTTYSAQWLVHSAITQGGRGSEVKHVVARELNWWVEETVKRLIIPAAHDSERYMSRIPCEEQCVRQLCDARMKGRWTAPGGSNWIEIPFDISIPAHAEASHEIHAASYVCEHRATNGQCDCRQVMAITVEHHLTLEVVTGEDTFHLETGDLVDRKPRVKSFKAVFPLPVQDVITADNLHGIFQAPPEYGEPYPLPPDYSNAM